MFNRHPILLISLCLCVAGCSAGGGGGDGVSPTSQASGIRVYENPYGKVDWNADLRLKAQHHDHIRLNLAALQAYDDAGYDVISGMDYSGASALTYTLKSKLWPVEAFLPTNFRARFRHIKLFIPNGEEVGLARHVTSSFMEATIDKWDPSTFPTKQSWQYSDLADLYAVIRSLGGIPILAHPWNPGQATSEGIAASGVEVYSAFAEAQRRSGVADYVNIDRAALLVQYWDQVLASDQTTIGIAVNDHFGPYPDRPLDEDIRDSGKIVVLAKGATLPAYREAFERRAILAIKDVGVVKDLYPAIGSISVEATSIFIDTPEKVRWISMGKEIGVDNLLEFRNIPPGSRYIRAELRNSEGSITYTQAFAVRPVGDIDGDSNVDGADKQLCLAIASNPITNEIQAAACAAVR